MQDVIVTLGASGAGAILSAAGTDAWKTAREGTVKLFSLRGRKAAEVIDRRLEEIGNATFSGDRDDEQARMRELPRWTVRLEDLLEERPEAATELQELVQEITSRLPPRSSIQNIQNIKARDNNQILTNQGTMNVNLSAPLTESSTRPSTEIHFFTLGCAVGNGLSILPIGETGDDTTFQEFLTALRDARAESSEIRHFQDLKRIINEDGASGEKIRGAVEDYIEAIQGVIRGVRNRARGDELQWFNLGRLLYGIAIHQVLPDESDRELRAERNALSGIAESVKMPVSLRSDFVSFASTNLNDAEATLGKANEIARTCYAYL